MANWQRREDSRTDAKAIVFLDNKGITRDIFNELMNKGLPVHIFASNINGKHQHNIISEENAGHHCLPERRGELEHIRRLHQQEGVAAIVVESTYVTEREGDLMLLAEEIRKFAPNIKVIAVDPSPNENFFVKPLNFDYNLFLRTFDEKGVVYPGDKEVPLAPRVDVAISTSHGTNQIEQVLRKLLPQLNTDLEKPI